MTRALVIYESMYGNTEQIAMAIGEGLSRHATVEVVEVGAAPTEIPPDVDVIAVGGPTHAFSMSRPGTREAAAKDSEGPLVSSGIGVREWLQQLEPPGGRLAAATFDTHAEHPRLLRHAGSAAAPISRRLAKLGIDTVAGPEHFWVEGSLGPLRDGELDRARAFGSAVAASAGISQLSTSS